MVMLQSYRSPKTKVLKSPTHGRGLFAIKPITKGEVVAIKGGHVIDRKTRDRFNEVIRDSELQVADNFFLAPLKKSEREEVMLFMNHSCDPNVGTRGEITFVAMRNIKKGEELTIDYAMNDNNDYRMKCECGLENCRKIITGKDWRRKDLQKKYRKYFSRYLQEKIDYGLK